MTAPTASTQVQFTEASHQALADRAIPLDVAVSYGITAVRSQGDLPQELRWAWDGPGMVIPWRDRERTVPQYRPDNPQRIHTDRETGKPEDGPRKYLFPSGCGSPWNWLRQPVESNAPVIVVEGALKGPAVAAWAPNGYAVAAIVGCWSWKDADLSWALGRDVYLVFDKDTTSNLKVWRAASDFGAALREVQGSHPSAAVTGPSGTVRYVRLPPGEDKDGIDDVLGRVPAGARVEALAKLLSKTSNNPGSRPLTLSENARILPDPKNPSEVAKALIPKYRKGHLATLINRDGIWYQWQESHWTELTDSQMTTALYRETQDKVFQPRDKTGPMFNDKGEPVLVPWNPNRTNLAEVRSALQAEIDSSFEHGLTVRDGVWLDESGRGRVMSFSNGLLDLKTRELSPHTPAYFNLSAVPYAYDPQAPAPVEWEKFLVSLWPAERESVDLLQEWFGYVVSGRIDLHKALLLLGPKRSGKSTIMRVLESVIGHANYVGISMGSLATNFGMQEMIGKTVANIGDARIQPKDRVTIMEKILTMTGGDAVQVDRKYAKPWNGTMSARLTIVSNRVPDFPDESGALSARFLTLTTSISFLGREDRGIEDRTGRELSGILLWALDGMDRLYANGGRFSVPPSAREAEETYARQAAPVTSFLSDWTVADADGHAVKGELYEAYKTWCQAEGIDHPLTMPKFAAALFETGQGIRSSKPRINGKQVPVFSGVRLTAVHTPGVGWSAPEGEQTGAEEPAAPAEDIWATEPTTAPEKPAQDVPLVELRIPAEPGQPMPVPEDNPSEIEAAERYARSIEGIPSDEAAEYIRERLEARRSNLLNDVAFGRDASLREAFNLHE